MSNKKPARGRPAKSGKPLLAPVMVRFPQAMIDAIDDVAASRLDQPDRSSVIRELIAEALEARLRRAPSR